MKLKEKCFNGMSGAYAAMFTPIDAKNRINEEAIDQMVEFGIANGLAGFYLTGSTGAWFLLTPEERKIVWKRAVKAAKGRCKLIAHVGATSTDESVALAKTAADIGVDWLSSVAPPVFCTNFNRTFYHYKKVSEATDLPFMAYSIGADLVPERDIRFFDLKNVKGMKYTGRDYYAAQTLKRELDKRKETIWFAGCDEQLLCALALDGVFSGGIGTTYNMIPRHFAKICELAAKNDFKAAAKYQDEANQVVRLMIESDNWSYRKAMMKLVGIDVGPYRKPFEKLTPAQEKAFLKRVLQLNVIKVHSRKVMRTSVNKRILLVLVTLFAGLLGARDFDPRDYGARGDGVTKDTRSLQKAIDACHDHGGGRVVLDGGVFMTAPILLKSGVELHIDASAKLVGSPDLPDYPNRTDLRHVNLLGCPRMRNTALIIADECENIAITGRGKIDGNGWAFVRRKADQAGSAYPGYPYERIAEPTNSLPRTVMFAGCRNVRVTDVTMVGTPAGWTFWVHDCDYVHFDRVNVLLDVQFPNNDGIHVNCSRDVTISNCILETGDDSIIVRANSSSLKENKPCERITVVNCTMKSWCSGIRIGWVNDGVIRNCTFSNLVMFDCTKGISIQMGDPIPYYDIGREPSLYENITFSNIVMDRIYTHPLMVETVENPKTRIDRVCDIRFSHVHAKALCSPYFFGRSTNPFRNFQFDNCTFDLIEESELPMRWDLHGCSSYNRKGNVAPTNCTGFVSDLVTERSWPDVRSAR